MPKLLTPQQYENSLDELNELRPLQLADETQHKIDIAVCDKLPVSSKKAVAGMLIKGTQQGSLLVRFDKDYPNYEVRQPNISYIHKKDLVSFAQKVSFVLSVVVNSYGLTDLWWTDSSYNIILKELSITDPTFIEFSGTDLYVKGDGIANWGCIVFFYGFY